MGEKCLPFFEGSQAGLLVLLGISNPILTQMKGAGVRGGEQCLATRTLDQWTQRLRVTKYHIQELLEKVGNAETNWSLVSFF